MGKKKLLRFRELGTLERVFQPPFEEVHGKDFHLKGRWGLDVFNNVRPLILELGCGKGEYTVGLARNQQDKNFMGLDIKGARLWTGARIAQDEDLGNVAFVRTRIDFIGSFFAKDEVDELWITFPDPQEKLRRKKKRLAGAQFLNRYRALLKSGGKIHLKTDNQLLYQDTLALARFNELTIESYTGDLYREDWNDETTSIQTYYEKRFLSEGTSICYLRFLLPDDQEIMELPDELQ